MTTTPYPVDLVTHWQLADGRDVTIRPISPDDAEIEEEFVRNLSEQARYLRFMSSLNELSPEMTRRFTHIDYHNKMAFIATVQSQDRTTEIAVVRYSRLADGSSCEFALVVADAWQHHGLGYKMMSILIDHARKHGLKRMIGEVLTANSGMLLLVRDLGFAVVQHPDDPTVWQVSLML